MMKLQEISHRSGDLNKNDPWEIRYFIMEMDNAILGIINLDARGDSIVYQARRDCHLSGYSTMISH